MYDLNKQFIFTHPPKAGGTSIEELLGFLQLRKKYPNVHRFKHASLSTHIAEIENKGLDSTKFFKFSIIRNPWDRAVSFYNHNRYKEYEYHANKSEHMIPMYVRNSRIMTFKEFVFKYYKNNFNSKSVTQPYMVLNDELAVDAIIKLENIKKDFFLIADKLQMPSDFEIPHLNNADIYIERKDYREYYDEETKDFVYALFKWDIETFNYTF